MKVPKLFARNVNGLEGRIVFPDDWWEYTPVTRANVLTDWIYLMRLAQVEAIEAIGDKGEQLKAGYDLEPPQQRTK